MKIRIRLILAFLLISILALLLSSLPVNSNRISEFEANRLQQNLVKQLEAISNDTSFTCNLVVQGEALLSVAQRLPSPLVIGNGKKQIDSCSMSISQKGFIQSITLQGDGLPSATAQALHIGWYSLLPALLAVAIAIATRRLLLGLFLGVVIGGLLLGWDGSAAGPTLAAVTQSAMILYHVMVDDFHFYIFLFTFALIGMVNVCTVSGGMRGLADLLGKFAKNARSTQLATALLGVLIFFDDYSNTVVVGSSMRPLSDRAQISREKLAYLVDSTAAPIAGLALISTWIGYEVGLIGDAMQTLGMDGSPYAMFLSTLPYRFYCLFALIFLFLSVGMGRDFGPMLQAERRARKHNEVLREGSTPLAGAQAPEAIGRPRAHTAILPVLLVIFITLSGMAFNGAGLISPDGLHSAAWSTFDTARLFALKDNYLIASQDGGWVLAMASLAGSFLAIILGWTSGKTPFTTLLRAWLSAWRVLLLAFAVLILAWAIGDANNQLGTGQYMVSLLADTLPNWILPVLIFLLAAFISFATGSSWGTMAVLLPAAVPLAFHVGGMPVMVISIGAVLDGAIFGDHCSPLSDTTIMSSIAAACDHLDHVRTQMPYALVVGVGAILLGYLPASMLQPLFAYTAALFVFSIVLKTIGRNAEHD